MENNTMNNNNYYGQQQGMMGQPYYGGYVPNVYSYPAMGYTNMPSPAHQNALTAEEIQILKNARPNNKIELSIDRTDVLRSMCCHKENGRDIVVQVNDGSGDVYCPLCGVRWKPDAKSKEEVQELVKEIVDQMEIAKWTGDLPIELTRELFTLIPLLKKYPDIHEYAMNTFNKYYNAYGMFNAQDTNIYGMYNSLFSNTPNMGYAGMPMQGYYGQQPQMNGYYNQQPTAPQGYYGQQPQMNGYYGQQPQQGYMPNTTQMNPYANPMQAPMYGGVNPAAPNQQFVQQANMMMGGTVQQPMNNGPVFGTPNAQQNNGQCQPTGQQTGPVIKPKGDGTVTSEKKIEL